MAVHVPGLGLTERVQVKNTVTQGGPLGPTMCAIHIDKIGKEALQRECVVSVNLQLLSVFCGPVLLRLSVNPFRPDFD